MEFNISNTTTAAVQLTPSPFLVDRIRIRNSAGNILQEATGDQIYQELCFNYSQNHKEKKGGKLSHHQGLLSQASL